MVRPSTGTRAGRWMEYTRRERLGKRRTGGGQCALRKLQATAADTASATTIAAATATPIQDIEARAGAGRAAGGGASVVVRPANGLTVFIVEGASGSSTQSSAAATAPRTA